MAGNELEVVKKLVEHICNAELHHIGRIQSVGAPSNSTQLYLELHNEQDVDSHLRTEGSQKKADIYINGRGVSIKQQGASFLYNRLQRKNIVDVFNRLNFGNAQETFNRVDSQVIVFHNEALDGRNQDWADFFTENEFKILLEFLMMAGSPNVGVSSHQAEYILEAPRRNCSIESMRVFTFDEYFEQYKDKIKVAIRRQWVGQASHSEHTRAFGISRNSGNAEWVFNNVVGEPTNGWMPDFPPENRKTVYFLMMEKVV